MNPAILRMKVFDQQPLIRKHDGCTNTELRFSRIKELKGHNYVVHKCDECGHEEEVEIGVLQ